MTTDTQSEVLREALETQMSDGEVQSLPSSMCRDRGLVWLEGWFDIRAAFAALSAQPEQGEVERDIQIVANWLMQERVCKANVRSALQGLIAALRSAPKIDDGDTI